MIFDNTIAAFAASIAWVAADAQQSRPNKGKNPHCVQLDPTDPCAFKATCKERWDAAKAGVGTELVPTQEQANWPAQRRLMYDRDDGTIHRVAHVGWHDEHQCVVAWIYLMADKDTQMPKVAGKTLDQDQCEAVNMADSVEMIKDYNEARRAGELPFDAE